MPPVLSVLLLSFWDIDREDSEIKWQPKDANELIVLIAWTLAYGSNAGDEDPTTLIKAYYVFAEHKS